LYADYLNKRKICAMNHDKLIANYYYKNSNTIQKEKLDNKQ